MRAITLVRDVPASCRQTVKPAMIMLLSEMTEPANVFQVAVSIAILEDVPFATSLVTLALDPTITTV